MDYKPEPGKVASVDVVCGSVMSSHNGTPNTARGAIGKRLALHGGAVACIRHELLIPPGAPDHLRDVDRMIALYEDQMMAEQRDLLVIFTMRFDDTLTFHAQWELARGFVHARMARQRQLAVVIAQHQPGLAGFSTKGHCHAIAFSRRLVGSHFRDFTPVAKPGAKAILGQEWADWLSQQR